LKEIKSDGTYDVIYKRWFVDNAEEAVMPPFENKTSDKKLIAGVSVDDLPYVAFMNGEYVGFDIELIKKFAERNQYELEFVSVEFPSLIAALSSGKVNMIADGISITEERQKQVDFSDSYADFSAGVVISKKNFAAQQEISDYPVKKPFFKFIAEGFYNNMVFEKRYLLIIDGLKTTILISIFAALIGTLFGGLICFMRMSKKKVLLYTAKGYISLLRGTPVLVLLMIIYYIVFASVNISPVLVAMVAFGLNFAAYVSEMFRTSIESIDKGQKEAGIAGGFTKIQTFIFIIMPQALQHVLPVYKGEFISLVKATSIVGYIAVQDLTKASDIIRSRTFDAFFPLIMAAVLYLIIAWILTWALGYVELSVDPKRKRIQRIQEANK
jgi:polar amino acid transport system substrate-binding protein